MEEKNFKFVEPLALWDGGLNQYSQHFMTGMQFHGPFIATKVQARNDLGDCVISTWPPHLVCKVHDFRTWYQDGANDRTIEIAQNQERLRREYLQQRADAFDREKEAARQGITVRQLVEKQGRVYDEELDEPRIVCKVPGLNAYLELVGCLDAVDMDEIEWTGEHGVLDTLDKMACWAPNLWQKKDRRPRATDVTDLQPQVGWQRSYREEERPMMTRKRGLGHTLVDPSRRPEMLYVKTPQGSDEYEMIKELKRAQAENASQGIAPENYGKKH